MQNLHGSKKGCNFATQFGKTTNPEPTNAKIAQLVEHDLAKVGVAGSSPVFRSNSVSLNFRPGGGIGRHATLRG